MLTGIVLMMFAAEQTKSTNGNSGTSGSRDRSNGTIAVVIDSEMGPVLFTGGGLFWQWNDNNRGFYICKYVGVR